MTSLLPARQPNAGALLWHEADYDTAYIGKWHLSDEGAGPVSKAQRGGYDYWLASNVLEFTSDAYDMVMYDGDGAAQKLPGYRVDAQTDAMIRYISSHQDRPFFLFSSFVEPHHQNHRGDFPAPTGIRRTISRALAAAGSSGAWGFQPSANGRLPGHDQAAGRSAGPAG